MRGKQYIKKGVWCIGGKKRKQTGGAIPLGLLASIGAPILGEIAKPILGKLFGRGRKCDVKEKDEMREKIVLRQRTTPKIDLLPNGTTFTARYDCISRRSLPSNIRVKKVRKIGARNRNKAPLSVNDFSRLNKISTKRGVRFNLSSPALKKLEEGKALKLVVV